MSSKVYGLIKICTWIGIVLFCLMLFYDTVINGKFVDFQMIISYISKAVAIVGVLFFLYDKILWKHGWFNFCNVPVLAKKYKGEFKTTFDDKVRQIEMTVKQSFLMVNVTFQTEESSSSTVVALTEEINAVKQLIYLYLNEPHGDLRDESPIHYGVSVLTVEDIEKIEGDYFTDRKTTGHMVLRAVKDCN